MRPICAGCARPASVCLCAVIPAPPLPLRRTRLLVLQHPHELKHKLATVPVLARCVSPCHVLVGRRLHSANWPFRDGAPTLLLFPGPDAAELKVWHAERGGDEDGLPRLVQELAINTNDHNNNGPETTLVVIDGTWEHAQEMVKASLPFLSTFAAQVCLPFDVRAAGHGVGESDLIMRKEPYGGCVSTMEAVARALAVLEGGDDGEVVARKLMDVLRKMVSLQASHFSAPKVRPKLKKKSKEGSEN